MKQEYDSICKKHFNKAFESIKYHRDTWGLTTKKSLSMPSLRFGELWDEDINEYQFVMQQVKQITQEAVLGICTELATLRDSSCKIIKFDSRQYVKYYMSKSKEYSRWSGTDDGDITAIATEFKGKRYLFIFKEFGIGKRVPNELIDTTLKQNGIKQYCYVSLVDSNAYSEVINHNSNENDPSRGTNVYPLPFILNNLFGIELYPVFLKYYLNYCKTVNEYLGLALVKSLRPNVLFGYRRHIRDNLVDFDYLQALSKFSSHTLSLEQKAIIDNQYVKTGSLLALTSMLPFSKCFMTAEWLFSSLQDSAESIDLTVISMGYFKALEQYLYLFVGQHTSEKDGKRREYAFKDNVWQELTNECYVSRKKDITLGGLAKFLKNRRNRDLLNPLLTQETYDVIRDVLSMVASQRNGYFHKDNITSWDKIEEDRELTLVLFYLLLGAFKFSDYDKDLFGIHETFLPSEAERACMYVNRLAHPTGNPLEIPVLYFSASSDKDDFWFPCTDDRIVYNEYGDPKHSGIYYRKMYELKEKARCCMVDELPQEIYEGFFICQNECSLTGPIKAIWINGSFKGNT